MRILSLDAETNGLWGQTFAAAIVVIDDDGNVRVVFVGRCPIEGEVNPWVAENVLPVMAGIEVNYGSYKEMLEALCACRAELLKEGDVVELVHMGVPVEAKLYMDAHAFGIIGDFDGPYPLVDCSAIPEIGDSVDGYNAKYGISPDPAQYEGGTHNPLYDATAAAVAYRHWLQNR